MQTALAPHSRDREQPTISFPIRLRLRYEMTVGYLHTGEGHTVSMSRTGVIFEAPIRLPVDRAVRLKIDWPVKLDNELELTLDVQGTTVAAEGNRISVEIHRHQLRIRPMARAASA